MKATLIAILLLVLPVAAAATVAMDPHEATRPPQGQQPGHRQLFTVKYVLRMAPPEKALPEVVMDRTAPEIVPPPKGSVPAMLLGALNRDPNAIICYGRDCESDGR